MKTREGLTNRMFHILLVVLFFLSRRAAAVEYANDEAHTAQEKFRLHLEESGMHDFRDLLQYYVNEWKDFSIHIGVTGQSGVGKSSFINTMRNLKANDPGAAPVGVSESTDRILSYRHPNNTKIIYWDLPGCGTPSFPRDKYMNMIDFKKFDALIIITASRFHENDQWLVSQARDHGKPFFLVRNKIDSDLKSEEIDHPDRLEHDILKQIKGNCRSQIHSPNMTIYTISSRLNHVYSWDFPQLMEDITDECPNIKQQAMLLSIASVCKELVRKKVQLLHTKIWAIATLSAATGLTPIPGLGLAIDIALLENGIHQFKVALALDTDSLVSLVDTHGRNMNELKRYFETFDDRSYYPLLFGPTLATDLIKRLASYTSSMVAKEAIKYIPFVGQVVSSTTSFFATFQILHDVLGDLEAAAMQLLDFIKNHPSTHNNE